MEVIRLPGIHHDTSISIVAGSEKSVLIDSGTSWHQVNIEERINSKIELLPKIKVMILREQRIFLVRDLKLRFLFILMLRIL